MKTSTNVCSHCGKDPMSKEAYDTVSDHLSDDRIKDILIGEKKVSIVLTTDASVIDLPSCAFCSAKKLKFLLS